MSNNHLNLLFPQWQGGGQDLSTYEGGQQLKELYFTEGDLEEVNVSTDKLSDVKRDILGYEEICSQFKDVKAYLAAKDPDTIFTFGGGCDADLTSIAFLNEKNHGDMAVLYIDAHGDLNTPWDSPSKQFYGMPLRTLLGEGEQELVNLVPRKLMPHQVILAGTRDLDASEQQYVDNQNVSVFSVEELGIDFGQLLKKIGSKKLYVHVDLDVLDPGEYPNTPIQTGGGLPINILQQLLERLEKECTLVGLGLFEYQPLAEPNNPLIQQLINLGKNL